MGSAQWTRGRGTEPKRTLKRCDFNELICCHQLSEKYQQALPSLLNSHSTIIIPHEHKHGRKRVDRCGHPRLLVQTVELQLVLGRNPLKKNPWKSGIPYMFNL